jgi:hypothetical protein
MKAYKVYNYKNLFTGPEKFIIIVVLNIEEIYNLKILP